MMRKESVHIERKPYKKNIPIYLVWLVWRAAAVLNLQYFISRDFVLLWNLFYNKPLVQHVPESQGVERKVLHPVEK